MTSSAPWVEQLLVSLHNAAPGSYAACTPAQRYDLDAARRMPVEARLINLDEILRFAEAHCVAAASTESIHYHDLRL